MARKKTEKPEMPATVEPKTKPVRLDLTEEEHRILRIAAAEVGKPMSIFARESAMRAAREIHAKRGR